MIRYLIVSRKTFFIRPRGVKNSRAKRNKQIGFEEYLSNRKLKSVSGISSIRNLPYDERRYAWVFGDLALGVRLLAVLPIRLSLDNFC